VVVPQLHDPFRGPLDHHVPDLALGGPDHVQYFK
jgi:hypothetical protein